MNSWQDLNTNLLYFIVYTLHRTKLHWVTFRPLSSLSPVRGSSSHRHFMITSTVTRDDTYSNKSQSIVGRGIFQLPIPQVVKIFQLGVKC